MTTLLDAGYDVFVFLHGFVEPRQATEIARWLVAHKYVKASGKIPDLVTPGESAEAALKGWNESSSSSS